MSTQELPDIDDVIASFAFLDDWEDRYRYLIELGRDHTGLPDALKTDANKVSGCTSQVWFHTHSDQAPRLSFSADSDAHIVKGLIAVLLAAYSGRTPAEIAAVDIKAIFTELGLDEHLSPNRRNGFFAMVERIRSDAAAAQAEAGAVSS